MKEAFKEHPYLITFFVIPAIIGLIVFIIMPKDIIAQQLNAANEAQKLADEQYQQKQIADEAKRKADMILLY